MNKKQISISCKGYSIAADWYEGDSKGHILLVFVGYGSSKERNTDFIADVAAKAHMSALVVDYSGHGESPLELNDTSPAQHLLETVTAFDWLQTEYPEAGIIVMGTSYGAFMAAYLTRFRTFNRLVLRTPAIYQPSDFYSSHANIDKIAVHAYRSDIKAVSAHPLFLQKSKFDGATLLVVHENDESVPKETTDIYKKIFSADTYLAQGFKHAMRDPTNPSDKVAEYQETIAHWITR